MTRALIPHGVGVEMMGRLPDGVTVTVWEGADGGPPDRDDVEFYVPGFAGRGPYIDAIDELPRLRVVQLLFSGYDHLMGRIPSGVTLCTARGAHAAAVSEWILAAILATLRRFPYHLRRFAERAPEEPTPADGLDGKRVLILGYGAIGEAFERRLAGFEVEIARIAGSARPGVDPPEALAELAPSVDVLVVLAPLTERTRGLVDARVLAALPDGAILVNAARGEIVDEAALLAEVRSGRLLAALDVAEQEPLPADDPLRDLSDLFYTPHASALTPATMSSLYELVGRQLRAHVEGRPLENVVDPEDGREKEHFG